MSGANIELLADHELTMDGAARSGGGMIDITAGSNVHLLPGSSLISSSLVVDGESGHIVVRTLNGNIEAGPIEASSLGTGRGGDIILDANGVNSDVHLRGAVTTNGLGIIDIAADDAIVLATSGSITAAGSGDISLRSNAVSSNGNSGDGINMQGASFIRAGDGSGTSGQILLRSTGTNGGPILVRQLTTDGNTIQIDSGNSISLQDAIRSGGGLVDMNARTSLVMASGSIVTGSQAGDAAAGAVQLFARSSINLTGAVDTSGAAGGDIQLVTRNGSISVGPLNASSSLIGAGGDISLNAVGVNADVTLRQAVTTNADVNISAGRGIAQATVPGTTAPISGHDVTLTATRGNIGLVGSVFTDPLTPLVVNASGDLLVNAVSGSTALTPSVLGSCVFNTLNLALISSDTLTLGDVAVSGDLRIEAADVVPKDGSLDLAANRLLFLSGQAETLTVTSQVLDARSAGSLTIMALSNIELRDLNADGLSLTTTSPLASVRLDAAGSLTVTDSVTTSMGNILLAASGDLTVNRSVWSNSGHITLMAGDDLAVHDTVKSGGEASIYLSADNQVAGDASPISVDGMNLAATVSTKLGSILAHSSQDLRLTSNILSQAGNIALIADGQLVQAADVMATAGSGLISAGGDILMSSDAKTTAGLQLIYQADRDVVLGRVQSTYVAIHAGRDISDGNFSPNGDAINVTADQLLLHAGGQVGQSDTGNSLDSNRYAIDTNVGVVAASSGTGVYLNEVASGPTSNDIRIDQVQDMSVNVQVQQVRIDGGLTARNSIYSLNGMSDISAGGPVKIVADNGSIYVNDGRDSDGLGISTTAAGDVLLEAHPGSGALSSIVTTTGITTNGGNITVIAADNVLLGDDVRTTRQGSVYVTASSGFISLSDGLDADSFGMSTGNGDILLYAQSNITLDASLTSQGGDIGLVAGQNILQSGQLATAGDVVLLAGQDLQMTGTSGLQAGEVLLIRSGGTLIAGQLVADAVSIEAAEDVRSANSTAMVTAHRLKVVADADGNGSGSIQINTQADVLAAQAAGRIEILEADDVAIDHVQGGAASVQVQRAHFNSSRTLEPVVAASFASLDDITSTAGNSISIVSLAGSVLANDGQDGDGLSIATQGTSPITLLALGDIIVNAGLESGSGYLDLQAGDDISINVGLHTSGTGTLSLLALNNARDALAPQVDGININAPLTSDSGNMLITSAGDMRIADSISTKSGELIATASGNIQILSTMSTPANISLTSLGGHIAASGNSNISADRLTLQAATFAHLPNTSLNSMSAELTNSLNARLSNTSWQDSAANAAGQAVLGQLGHTSGKTTSLPSKPLGDTPDFATLQDMFGFQTRFDDSYALFLRNAGDLEIAASQGAPVIFAQGAAPSIYVQTTAGSDLTISGDIQLVTTRGGADPGIVLISGKNLNLNGNITTLAAGNPDLTQRVNDLQFQAGAFDAGQLMNPLTTRTVISQYAGENNTRHVNQRVSMEFGNAGERGFLSVVHYADGGFELFDTQGDIAQVASNGYSLAPGLGGEAAIPASQATLFARDNAFNPAFLDSNQELPTDVVIRRSLDFFLFSTDADGRFIDHTSAFDEVLNVITDGAEGGLPLPVDPVFPVIAEYVPQPLQLLIEPVPQQPPPQIELETPPQSNVVVAIYRVDYTDANLNGQVDAAELPSFEEVLRNGIDSESQASRKIIEPKTAGETPTREDIQREKSSLQKNPNQPSGAYAIIREDGNGTQTVLDVFGIRDWPEGQGQPEPGLPEPQGELPTLEPFVPSDDSMDSATPSVPLPNDQSGNLESNLGNSSREMRVSRLASSSLLLGSLWMIRGRIRSSTDTTYAAQTPDTTASTTATRDFSRRARRSRRRQGRRPT